MTLPKNLHVQWDNCGENKNKEMLIFNSLLVEMGYFTNVTMGFLIVGHTHASIDQYFSCLRRRIRRANFIASPLALHNLFTYALHGNEKKKKVYRPPLKQIQLTFVRDYVKAFAPYYNNKITNYGVPYDFKFFLVHGKCVMQYRQFSMPSSAPWFPEAPLLPALSKEAMVQIQTRNEVPQIRPTHSLYTEEGQSALQDMVGISTKKATIIDLYSNMSQDERQRAETYNIMLPHLQELENRAMVEQNLRAGDEAD